jgi:hypothetical protein
MSKYNGSWGTTAEWRNRRQDVARTRVGRLSYGYEVHEDEACITHRKQSPNFYPLNSHLIALTVDANLDRFVPFIHSASPTSDPDKQISW